MPPDWLPVMCALEGRGAESLRFSTRINRHITAEQAALRRRGHDLSSPGTRLLQWAVIRSAVLLIDNLSPDPALDALGVLLVTRWTGAERADVERQLGDLRAKLNDPGWHHLLVDLGGEG